MSEKKDRKIQIIVAIIGFVGVLVAAIISNWDKLSIDDFNSKGKDTTKITASLDRVIFYEGDKGIGNQNICTPKEILVREVYHIKNAPFPSKSLKLHHSSAGGSIEIPISNIRNDLVDYSFCASPSLLNTYNIKTIFLDTATNHKSNIVEFTINIKDKKIEKPKEWGKLFN